MSEQMLGLIEGARTRLRHGGRDLAMVAALYMLSGGLGAPLIAWFGGNNLALLALLLPGSQLILPAVVAGWVAVQAGRGLWRAGRGLRNRMQFRDHVDLDVSPTSEVGRALAGLQGSRATTEAQLIHRLSGRRGVTIAHGRSPVGPHGDLVPHARIRIAQWALPGLVASGLLPPEVAAANPALVRQLRPQAREFRRALRERLSEAAHELRLPWRAHNPLTRPDGELWAANRVDDVLRAVTALPGHLSEAETGHVFSALRPKDVTKLRPFLPEATHATLEQAVCTERSPFQGNRVHLAPQPLTSPTPSLQPSPSPLTSASAPPHAAVGHATGRVPASAVRSVQPRVPVQPPGAPAPLGAASAATLPGG